MRDKKPTGKTSVRERLEKKRKELAERGKGLPFLVLKDGTMRIRVLPVGDEEEFGREITQFYLGGQIKGVISPSSLGRPCPILEKYLELKDSKSPADKALAKKIAPKKKTLIPVLVYADKKGKEVDEDKSGKGGKLFLVTSGIYASMIDSYLDEDDWGDFTDVDNGYDFKVSRTGTTQFDTEYSVSPCPKTPCPKAYRNIVVDLEAMVSAIIPTYEEAAEKLAEYLNEGSDDDDDEEEKPRRSKKVRGKKREDSDDLPY